MKPFTSRGSEGGRARTGLGGRQREGRRRGTAHPETPRARVRQAGGKLRRGSSAFLSADFPSRDRFV